MKKLRTLGIVTMVLLVLIIGALAAFAALGFFEPDEYTGNENGGEISIEPSIGEDSAEQWRTSETAVIKTEKGDIIIELGDCAAAEKFMELSDYGIFDFAEFITLADNMFIQTGVYGEGFPAEETGFSCGEGAVGFVMEDGEAFPSIVIITAELSGDYDERVLVFARVASGMETVRAIAESENSGYTGGFAAVEPVKINGIGIVSAEE